MILFKYKNFWKFLVFFTLFLFVINTLMIVLIYEKYTNNIYYGSCINSTSKLFSKISEIVVKSNSIIDNDIGIVYNRVKIIKIKRINDMYSKDGKEEYILIIEPIDKVGE